MRSYYRLTIFLTAFGAALLALLFVAVTMADVAQPGAAHAAVHDCRARDRRRHRRGVARVLGPGRRRSSSGWRRFRKWRGATRSAICGAAAGLRRRRDRRGGARDGCRGAASSGGASTSSRAIARGWSRFSSSMVEGVLVVDEQGRLQHVNDAARRMLRMDHDAINHNYVEAIRHPGIVADLTRVLAGEESQGVEFSLIRDVSRTLVARVAPVVVGRPRRGARAARHHRSAPRRSDSPRFRRQCLARAAHAAHRDQGLRRSAARRAGRPRRAAALPRHHPAPLDAAWSVW